MGLDQIRTLAGFMFPGKVLQFLKIYNKATSKPHGYLLIDSKQNTHDSDRLKTDIFQETVDVKDTTSEYNKHAASLEPSSFQDMMCDERHIAKLYHTPYVK